MQTPSITQADIDRRLRSGPPLLVPRAFRVTKPMDLNIKVRSLHTGIGESDLLREALRRGWEALGFGDIEALV